MAENSGTEWTTHTFNSWIGCTRINLACDHRGAEISKNRHIDEQKNHALTSKLD